VFLLQKIITQYFQFIENQWFVTRNIALACYPLALQTFIRFAPKICKP